MKAKITVSVDEGLLAEIDALVQTEQFESRSAAMEAALRYLQEARADARFERALASLTDEDVAEMQAIAEEGMGDWSEIALRNEW